MVSKIEVDEVVNQTGDNDSGIDLSTNDVIKFEIAGAEKARVHSDGNIGIGTDTPTVQDSGMKMIHIHNSATDGSGRSALKLTNGDSGLSASRGGIINYDDSANLTIGSFESSGKILFSSGGTSERIRIDSSGNLGVGVTSMNGSGRLYSSGSYNATTGLGANMVIESNGLISRSTSSQRYKNTIADASHGLAELMKLRAVTYKHNSNGDTTFGGLIAEEVHDANLTEFVQYDDEGNPDALAYGNMVSLCIKAIQELKAELDNAKARITALEGS